MGLILSEYPKWGDVTWSIDGTSVTPSVSPDGPNSSSSLQFLSDRSVGSNGDSDSTERKVDRLEIFLRNEKALRQEETRTVAVSAMAESAKCKSDSLEDQNSIIMLSESSAAKLPETNNFISAMMHTYLSRALKRAKMEEVERREINSGNNNVSVAAL